MHDDEVFENYLRDLGTLIRELALEARSSEVSVDPFECGRLMAYFEIVSLMQSQARTFGIAYETIGLAGIDPETDLL